MQNSQTQKDTKQIKKRDISLLERLKRIEKKLDVFNTMSKTMPVLLVFSIAMVTFVGFTGMTTQSIESNLPETGVQTTEKLKIVYPEENVATSTPVDIIVLSADGFYSQDIILTCFSQSESGITEEIGEMQRGETAGEYRIRWENVISGAYSLWVEVEDSYGNIEKSENVIINVK